MKIYNHISPKFSDLEKEMAKHIPPGEIGDPNNLEIQKTDNKESAKYFAKLKRERK
jgi:hypothetical protein